MATLDTNETDATQITDALSNLDTTQTVSVINDMNVGLANFIQDLLSPLYVKFPILAETVLGVPFANVMVAILVFLLFWALSNFFTKVVSAFLQKAAKITDTYHDDRIISALKNPMGFAFKLTGAHVFFLLIFQNTTFINNILDSLVIYTLFWAIISVASALRGFFHHTTSKFNPDLAKEMGDFILKIVNILLVGIGFGAILKVWGINVTALVASLGLGGLAFALAAKDTASNLFASFSLLADKSIRIGEWVKVNNVEGTVEAIGMRTTKIRSFQKSLITVPNQIIANNPIENYSRRGIRRIKMRLGLTYSTTGVQVAKIVEEIKAMLIEHEGISSKDTLLVNFESFGDSALNIFIYTFTATANWGKYLDIREDIHLQIMKIVEDNDSGFAFPSQSLYIESMPKNIESPESSTD
ncbi:MAG: mechanosensitive ion channel family protein [Epsilonproteobacteria bacterium]|nr:MAG: mechanosensitive ion channel family protein [Campylobacterota bacterium]